MYRIVEWNKHFENNRTRELKRLEWVPMPNKQDGDGYSELLDHPDGSAHYGVWCSLVGVASKCEPRGTLVRDGRTQVREDGTTVRMPAIPHDARSLARMTHHSEAAIQAAIDRLTSEIGWLEIIPDPVARKGLTIRRTQVREERHKTAPACGKAPMEWKGMEGKGNKEGAGKNEIPKSLDTTRFQTAWADWERHRSEIKKPLKPTQATKQLAMLEAIGEVRAVAMIEYTIEMGWQGLRERDGAVSAASRLPTADDLRNWNPVDAGIGGGS